MGRGGGLGHRCGDTPRLGASGGSGGAPPARGARARVDSRPCAGNERAVCAAAHPARWVVVTLFPPDSPMLKAERIREAEVYNMMRGVPGRIQSIVNIHNPSIEFHP